MADGIHSQPKWWKHAEDESVLDGATTVMWPWTVSLLGFAARISKGKLKKHPLNCEKEGKVWARATWNCTRTEPPGAVPVLLPDLALLTEMRLPRYVNPLGPPVLSKLDRLTNPHVITDSVV